MRGHSLRLGLLAAAAFLLSGCADVDVVDARQPTPFVDSTNQLPNPVLRLLNATHDETRVHFLHEPIHADATRSTDPDGHIQRHQWTLYRSTLPPTHVATDEGPNLTLRPETPGDYILVLHTTDDQHGTHFVAQSFSVHRRIVRDEQVLPQPPAPLPPGGVNLSMSAMPGILALSVHLTFPAQPSHRLRIEIRAPDGTLLNRTEGAASPLVATAPPLPDAHGNYTAHISLVQGALQPVRVQFATWHGYHLSDGSPTNQP